VCRNQNQETRRFIAPVTVCLWDPLPALNGG
jgi:hypothetical protein